MLIDIIKVSERPLSKAQGHMAVIATNQLELQQNLSEANDQMYKIRSLLITHGHQEDTLSRELACVLGIENVLAERIINAS